jgi:hypothetical protein
MLPTSVEPDLEGLTTWRARLKRQSDELRAEIRTKQIDLAQVEERLNLVTKLIEVETRANVDAPGSNGEVTASTASTSAPATHMTTLDLEQAVEQILRAAGEPLHISKIRETLVSRGIPIPGRGDDANIIVRLRRFEDRFTRTARGTYGLADWGIPALAGKARRRRRIAAR